jgi:hypothetical protein
VGGTEIALPNDWEVQATADVARRAVAPAATPAAVAANTITSTVYQTTYTVTSTTTSLATPTETAKETYYEVVTTTLTPPPETVCEGNQGQTITVISQGPPQTQTQVVYQTYNTWITIWVGQTVYQQQTDYNAMTACWAGGGYYGP